MKVKVRVKARKAWSRRDRDAAKAAMQFAIEQTGIAGWGKVILKLCAHSDQCGSAINLDDETFIVHVTAKADQDEMIKTIFHEMWHVRQYIFDGLTLEGGAARFAGEDFDVDITSCTHEEYWNTPWEIEARAFEEVCFENYNR